MCVICRGRFPKTALERYVVRVRTAGDPETAGGAPPPLVHDPEKCMDGRGRYVCERPACREKFKKFAGRSRKSQGDPK
ncbi:DUF448 domain-containing protein [Desulfolutivibrio sulfoxidireducens]|uniref:DUF448 domain-containing protein n=1 Tax=Desulfolutivibrio sulfoxidireducens TaxID=2773299 RepID=UPI001FEC54AB|nr:DUF448 domain-containing protein [Desulfolutivibrio sulfoxidireducens]